MADGGSGEQSTAFEAPLVSRPLEVRSRASSKGWEARLDLEISCKEGRSTLVHAAHVGPLRVQRPFYPEGHEACHLLVLHPPGGVVGGDRLVQSIQVRAAAHALATTPGATKLYRSSERLATLEQKLQVGAAGCLEWLPQETIAFAGSHAQLKTRLEVEPGGCAVMWEILCLGRPFAGERFTQGELRCEYEVLRGGELCFLERARYRGGDALLDAPWGLAGAPVLGTLIVVPAERVAESWIELIREQVQVEHGLLAATVVSELLVLRYRGPSTRDARAAFERAFALLRPLYAGRPALRPRIWNT